MFDVWQCHETRVRMCNVCFEGVGVKELVRAANVSVVASRISLMT
jgi:hypothetical protein